MVYTDYTDPIPDGLAEAILEGRCLLLAGSGVSRVCLSKTRKPLPDWPELLSGLVFWAVNQKFVDKKTATYLLDMVRKGDFLTSAEELVDRLGIEVVERYVDDVFDPQGIVPARRQELMAAMSFKGIITTNYDNLLERAYLEVHKRQIDVVRIDQPDKWKMIRDDPHARWAGGRPRPNFILKLHGDIESPGSLVLGYRRYMELIHSKDYQDMLDNIFGEHSVLMTGYGLGDDDINLAINRIAARPGPRPTHYLLSKRDNLNPIQRKRLLEDRSIHVIEYYDYFGIHNHIDTFIEALCETCSPHHLEGVRKDIGARMTILFPELYSEDGYLIGNFFFREGAAGLVRGPNPEESALEYFKKLIIETNMFANDYCMFIVPPTFTEEDEEYISAVRKAVVLAGEKDVGIIFFAVGVDKRPSFVSEIAPLAPVYYLPTGFSEKDLILVRDYVEQDLLGGRYRQP